MTLSTVSRDRTSILHLLWVCTDAKNSFYHLRGHVLRAIFRLMPCGARLPPCPVFLVDALRGCALRATVERSVVRVRMRLPRQ